MDSAVNINWQSRFFFKLVFEMLSPILEGKRWKTMRKYYIIHIYITGQPALAQKTSYLSINSNECVFWRHHSGSTCTGVSKSIDCSANPNIEFPERALNLRPAEALSFSLKQHKTVLDSFERMFQFRNNSKCFISGSTKVLTVRLN